MLVYDAAGNAFEIAGEDENEVGAIPGLARFNGGAARGAVAAPRPAAARPGFNPALFRPGIMQGAMAGGLSEARAREIVREELRGAMPTLQQTPNKTSTTQSNPLGLGFLKFDSTTGTALGLEARPQRGFIGERLVITIRRSGPTADAAQVSIVRFAVGDYNQLVGGAPLPAEIFDPLAVGVRLDLDASYPGVVIKLDFSIQSALAPGDALYISAGIIGSTVEISKP